MKVFKLEIVFLHKFGSSAWQQSRREDACTCRTQRFLVCGPAFQDDSDMFRLNYVQPACEVICCIILKVSVLRLGFS